MISLSDRQTKILLCVVEQFNATGEPVGSAAVSRSRVVDVSPATIRNVMSDLEECGLLHQPHTSAGRVPTASGMRFYVNYLYREEKFSVSSAQILAQRFDELYDDDIDQMARSAGLLISRLTHLTSLVALPRVSETRLREISLSALPNLRYLVLLITTDGRVLKRVVRCAQRIDEMGLQRMQNYLNEFAAGTTLRELRQRVRQELSAAESRCRDFMQQALRFSEQVLEAAPQSELYIEGTANIFDVADLNQDLHRLRDLIAALQEKERVIELLDRLCDVQGSKTLIGSELNLGLGDDFSLIVCGYHHSGEQLGMLGVLGPMRMDYVRLIPLVDQAARMLSIELDELKHSK